jgi:hypothetical protein
MSMYCPHVMLECVYGSVLRQSIQSQLLELRGIVEQVHKKYHIIIIKYIHY